MINRHPSDCRCCAAPAAVAEPEQIVELPSVATPIRVHTAGAPPFDCTLHPDGTLTAVFNGRPHRNLMSFADMRERNWRHARFEFDPPPLGNEPDQFAPVQDAIPLTA